MVFSRIDSGISCYKVEEVVRPHFLTKALRGLFTNFGGL